MQKSVEEKYRVLTKTLIAKHLMITTMESATAGQIASLITDTEGSSAIMKGAFITYSNEAKVMQGVPGDVIETYGVYSKETAEEMAKVCRRTYTADIGIGVTGTMGNVDPANHDSVPGQVYFAIDFDGEVKSFHRELAPYDTRHEYKLAVANEVVDELIKQIGE